MGKRESNESTREELRMYLTKEEIKNLGDMEVELQRTDHMETFQKLKTIIEDIYTIARTRRDIQYIKSEYYKDEIRKVLKTEYHLTDLEVVKLFKMYGDLKEVMEFEHFFYESPEYWAAFLQEQ